MTARLGMDGYCGGYWVGPVATADGDWDVCTGCGRDRPHASAAATPTKPGRGLGAPQGSQPVVRLTAMPPTLTDKGRPK